MRFVVPTCWRIWTQHTQIQYLPSPKIVNYKRKRCAAHTRITWIIIKNYHARGTIKHLRCGSTGPAVYTFCIFIFGELRAVYYRENLYFSRCNTTPVVKILFNIRIKRIMVAGAPSVPLSEKRFRVSTHQLSPIPVCRERTWLILQIILFKNNSTKRAR